MKEPTSESVEIGKRIRAARQKMKLSQEELAFRANMCAAHISDIELGKKRLLLDSFIKIIEVLQVSADSILRPDTPNTNGIYNQELAEILQDCSPAEMEAIITVAKQVKATIKTKRED